MGALPPHDKENGHQGGSRCPYRDILNHKSRRDGAIHLLRLELRKLLPIPPTDKENTARERIFDASLYAVSFDPSAFGLRGIGILPMMSSDHGQDARATFRQNRCSAS
jgi:hypothetical protein